MILLIDDGHGEWWYIVGLSNLGCLVGWLGGSFGDKVGIKIFCYPYKESKVRMKTTHK